jgi:peptide/nickel transport system permease protein
VSEGHSSPRSAAALPVAVLGALALAALLAPVLAPYDPARPLDVITLQNRPPSAAHLLGTDPYARDVLSRALHAARVSLGVGVLAAVVSATIGGVWGALAGVAGRRVDALMMRLVDIALGVPRVLVLLAIVALWGAVAPTTLALLLGATGWLGTSRLVRAQVVAARQREFAMAAVALGASPVRVLARHVAPHALATLAVAATNTFGDVVALEAGLSFLGLGVRPPKASWGSMIQDGTPYLADAWWTAAVPIAAVVLTMLAASALGDRLGDRLGGPPSRS